MLIYPLTHTHMHTHMHVHAHTHTTHTTHHTHTHTHTHTPPLCQWKVTKRWQNEKSDLFFNNYNNALLFVQDNYTTVTSLNSK